MVGHVISSPRLPWYRDSPIVPRAMEGDALRRESRSAALRESYRLT